MARRKQRWTIGDFFVVQNLDGKYTVGQVIATEPDTMGSVTVAFFDLRLEDPNMAEIADPIPSNQIISLVFTTPDLLNSRDWQVIRTGSFNIPPSMLPYEHLRESRFVGAKVIGSGIMVKFLDAFYGLRPWDDWHDPQYLDRILLSPEKKPKRLIYKNK